MNQQVGTNTGTGTPGGTQIRIEKITLGGTGSSSFTSSSGVFGSATVATTAPGVIASQTFDVPSNMVGQTFSITEGSQEGWRLIEADCFEPDQQMLQRSLIQEQPEVSPTVDVTVAEGKTMVCRFVNQKATKITVHKTAVGGSGTFHFTGIGDSEDGFDITTSGSSTAGATGMATFTGFFDPNGQQILLLEDQQDNWDLTEASCVTGSGTSPGTSTQARALATPVAGVRFTAMPGDDVHCYFTNKTGGGQGPALAHVILDSSPA